MSSNFDQLLANGDLLNSFSGDQEIVKIANRRIVQNWIEISYVSSVEAFNKLESDSTSWAVNNINRILVHLKITNEAKEEIDNSLFGRIRSEGKKIVAVIENTPHKCCRIFWKLFPNDNFYTLDLLKFDRNILSLCQIFLANEIDNGYTGILDTAMDIRNLNIYELGNMAGQNMLMIAAKVNDYDSVRLLLDCDFKVDYEDNKKYNAMDYAWNNHLSSVNGENNASNEIIFMLLKANSKYPRYSFDADKLSDDVKDLMESSEKLHDLVKDKNIDELRQKLGKLPILRRFYSRENISLLKTALKNYDTNIYDLLCSRMISYGSHENIEQIFEEIRKRSEEITLSIISSANRNYSLSFPKIHIHKILSKMQFLNNCIHEHVLKYNQIIKALNILDDNESCSIILQVVAACRDLEIFIDFENKAVNYLIPERNDNTLGLTLSSGKIYIGAKDLLDNDKEFEVIGTLIHEFCHLAMHLTYGNCFNPYPMRNSNEQISPDEAECVNATAECEKNKKLENLINFFSIYPKHQHHWEVIVRAMQIVMKYHNDSKTLSKHVKNNFPLLFKFFHGPVKTAMTNALDLLKKRYNEKFNIAFSDLTEPMKKRILHKTIQFQGQATTIYKMIGENIDFLNLFPPKLIRSFLNINETRICESTIVDLNKRIVIRKFKQFDEESVSRSVREIIRNMGNERIFILADEAGSGKTISIQNFAKEIKENKKDFYVAFICLKKHQNVLEEWKDDQNENKVKEILVKMLNQQNKVEDELFKIMFEKNKVILLFDSFDKIDSNLRESFIAMVKNLHNKDGIWQLIATRSFKKKYLEEELKINSYKFEMYSNQSLISLINLMGSANLEEISRIINTFRSRKNNRIYPFNNTLMIETIVNFCNCRNKSEDINLFDICYNINENIKQKNSSLKKLKGLKYILMTYSFMSIFGSINNEITEPRYNAFLQLEPNLSREIQIWKDDNIHIDTIQIFGYVELADEFVLIKFIHMIIPELFVVIFVNNYLFNSNKQICDEEFKKLIKLLRIMGKSINHDLILRFLIHSLQSTNTLQNQVRRKLFTNSQSAIIKEIEYIQSDIIALKADGDLFINSLHLWSIISKRDDEILNILWKISEDKNLIQTILFDQPLITQNFINFLNIISLTFGDVWYAKFLKNNNDNEINNYSSSNAFNKNLLNLFLLMLEKFNTDERKILYDTYITDPDVIKYVDSEVIIKYIAQAAIFFKNEDEYLIKVLILFLNHTVDEDVLKYLRKNIEGILSRDRDLIRKVLFANYVTNNHPIITKTKNDDEQEFSKVSNLYILYKDSYSELQNIFIKDRNLIRVILDMKKSIQEPFLKLIDEIFKDNPVEILRSIDDNDVTGKIELIMNEEKFTFFKQISEKIFVNNQKFMKTFIQKVLYKTDGHKCCNLNELKNNISTCKNDNEKTKKFKEYSRISKIYKEFNKNNFEINFDNLLVAVSLHVCSEIVFGIGSAISL